MIEGENAYHLLLAVPGISKEQTIVQLTDEGYLQVQIDLKKELEPCDWKGRKWLQHEFFYSDFKQTYVLPDEVDCETITASVGRGTLTIDLHKKQVVAAQGNRFIKVK